MIEGTTGEKVEVKGQFLNVSQNAPNHLKMWYTGELGVNSLFLKELVLYVV